MATGGYQTLKDECEKDPDLLYQLLALLLDSNVQLKLQVDVNDSTSVSSAIPVSYSGDQD